MNIIRKLFEKSNKAMKYIKLFVLFSKKSEFKSEHPELVAIWRKKFVQMIRYSSDRVWPIVEEFLNVKISRVSKKKIIVVNPHLPILICVLKNDIDKIQSFIQHYRNLGIKNFIFLDNMSSDGTFEFLLKQEDAVIYRCEHSFTADRKIAWLNRLIAEIGMNKWYLLVDSDEFFSYLGYSEHSLNDFIEKIEQKGLKRVGVIHLDMYPKGKLFLTNQSIDFIKDYCYFDKDTYKFSKAYNGIRIVGGPRKRVFGTNMKISGVRLVYFEDDDIVPSAHFMIPYFKGPDLPVYLVSRHYKFINESDYNKMLEAVRTGMHSNHSEEYKTYYNVLSSNPDISLYDEKHSLVFSEENLKVFSFLETLF